MNKEKAISIIIKILSVCAPISIFLVNILGDIEPNVRKVIGGVILGIWLVILISYYIIIYLIRKNK